MVYGGRLFFLSLYTAAIPNYIYFKKNPINLYLSVSNNTIGDFDVSKNKFWPGGLCISEMKNK